MVIKLVSHSELALTHDLFSMSRIVFLVGALSKNADGTRDNWRVTVASHERRLITFPVFLLIVSAIGILAAFSLTLEKIHVLQDPDATASCDFSILVQCGKNLRSWQGSLLGFPNALLGLMGWPVVAATGAVMLAQGRMARWYWQAFTIVSLAGLIFVFWLFSESVFELSTLCPWCMVTWVATISLFVVTVAWTMKYAVWGERLRGLGAKLLTWSPTIILGILLVEFIIAQLRLDVINHI